MLAQLEERGRSNWDLPASPEEYIEEIGPTVYIHTASVDPSIVVSVGPGPKVIVPLETKQLKPAIEATPTSQQPQALGAPTVGKGKRVYILALENKLAPLTKPKGIVIGAPTTPGCLC